MSRHWLDNFGADREVVEGDDESAEAYPSVRQRFSKVNATEKTKAITAETEYLAAIKIDPEVKDDNRRVGVEGWLLVTDRERVNKTPDDRIIWAKTVDDLVRALEERYPSPAGFTRIVHKPHGFGGGYDSYGLNGYLIGVGRTREIHGRRATYAQYVAAVQTGMPVYVGRSTDFLLKAGYEDKEVSFLIDTSQIGDIPIGSDMVLTRCGKLYQDAEAYAKAVKGLKRSRLLRKRRGDPTGERTAPIKAALIRRFLHEAHRGLREQCELPSWVHFHITYKSKDNLQRCLLDMVALWHRLARNKAYRQLESYREILIHLSVAKNMRASVKESQIKYAAAADGSYINGSNAYADFLKWVKGELAWARKRRLKYLKPKKR